jgi:hypothetical protein
LPDFGLGFVPKFGGLPVEMHAIGQPNKIEIFIWISHHFLPFINYQGLNPILIF